VGSALPADGMRPVYANVNVTRRRVPVNFTAGPHRL
jgi:hypothetical protein